MTSKADQSKNTTNAATLPARFSLLARSKPLLVATQRSSEAFSCLVSSDSCFVLTPPERPSPFLHCLSQHFKSILMNLRRKHSHMPSGNLHTSFYANDLEIIRMPPKLRVFMFEIPLYLAVSRSLHSSSLSRRARPYWNISTS